MNNSIGIIIVAHAPMAGALYAGARHCSQSLEHVRTLDVDPDTPPEQTEASVLTLIEEVDTGAGCLVLTDIVGATPSNASARAAARARAQGRSVEVLTGANTPMLLRALTYRCLPLEEAAERALAGAQKAMLRLDVNEQD